MVILKNKAKDPAEVDFQYFKIKCFHCKSKFIAEIKDCSYFYVDQQGYMLSVICPACARDLQAISIHYSGLFTYKIGIIKAYPPNQIPKEVDNANHRKQRGRTAPNMRKVDEDND